ncbi:MAG: lysostaphin resistance A-like protein [Chloroherpetonaceae bacterium]
MQYDLVEPPFWQRVLQNPFVRFFVMFITVTLVYSAGFGSTLQLAERLQQPFLKLIGMILTLVATYLVYYGLVRGMEGRRYVSELSLKGALLELIGGLGIGAGLLALSTLLLWLFEFYKVDAVNDVSELFAARHIPLSLGAGFFEELAFRAILFRIVEEKLGSWIALFISSLFFGIVHIANPNATLFSSVAIAVEAGILLGAAYMLTRRVWFAVGIHIAWNYVQGAVFGIAVSGTEVKGLISSHLEGNELFSGGAFGAEASLITLVVCTTAGVLLLWKSHQNGMFVQPFWKYINPIT